MGDTFTPLPEYVPEQIRSDYHEAYLIKDLSPKASATLCRRAIQTMIRDFFNVHENTLFDEINKIESLVTSSVKSALDSLRKIGNIGAHPENDINIIVDIEPGEADKLIMFINLLVKSWYTEKYETDKLLSDINQIAENKSEDRRG